jgi:hypothetical protein
MLAVTRLSPVAKAKAGLARCSRAPVGRYCLPGTQPAWPNQPGQHSPVISVITVVMCPAQPAQWRPACGQIGRPPFAVVGQWTWALAVSRLVPRGPCSLAWYCGGSGPGCALCSVLVGWPRALCFCRVDFSLCCCARLSLMFEVQESRVRSDIHVRAASVCYSVRV